MTIGKGRSTVAAFDTSTLRRLREELGQEIRANEQPVCNQPALRARMT